MSESWVGCPGCGLKHRLRAEGTCPRCQSAVVPGAAGGVPSAALALPAAPVAMPVMEAPAREERAIAEGAPSWTPMHWAGLVLLGNVFLVFLEHLMPRYQEVESSLGGGQFVSLTIDGLLGVSLVMGQDKYRSLALARAVIGGVLYTVLSLFQGNIILAIIQLAFSAALGVLLSEYPPRGRVRLALGAVGVLFALQLVGLHLLSRYGTPEPQPEKSSRQRLRAQDDLPPGPDPTGTFPGTLQPGPSRR